MLNGIVSRRTREIVIASEPVKYLRTRKYPAYSGSAQSNHKFRFAAIPVTNWSDELSLWEAPAVWEKQGFGGKAGETLCLLTEQIIPSLKQQFPLPENVKIILGGYSLAGLFALWASTQTDCSTVSLLPRPRCGFRAGWSLNNSTRYRHGTFI